MSGLGWPEPPPGDAPAAPDLPDLPDAPVGWPGDDAGQTGPDEGTAPAPPAPPAGVAAGASPADPPRDDARPAEPGGAPAPAEGVDDMAEQVRTALSGTDDTPIAAAAAAAVRVLSGRGFEQFPRPSSLRILTVANQKGGVGKTTSAVNLAVALALHGAEVLLVDLDPQGNASTALGVEHHVGTPDVYGVLVEGKAVADVVQPAAGVPRLRCVPATIDLAGAEIELVSMVAREFRLQRALAAYVQAEGKDLDYVVVDCPPSLGLLTVNALAATQEVLIPIQCEYYALEGLGQLLKTVELVRANLNPVLAVSTILLTMYDGRTRLSDQVAEQVRSHFGDLVLDSAVPRSVRVSEAPGYGQSVVTYDPGSRGALAYVAAAREIAVRGASA